MSIWEKWCRIEFMIIISRLKNNYKNNFFITEAFIIDLGSKQYIEVEKAVTSARYGLAVIPCQF